MTEIAQPQATNDSGVLTMTNEAAIAYWQKWSVIHADQAKRAKDQFNRAVVSMREALECDAGEAFHNAMAAREMWMNASDRAHEAAAELECAIRNDGNPEVQR